MPSDEDADHGEQLAHQAQSASRKAAELHQRVITTAEGVAATEEYVARTFDQMAKDHPERAGQLKDVSNAAREHAAHERQWIEDHTSD
jgi:hypothetical protein